MLEGASKIRIDVNIIVPDDQNFFQQSSDDPGLSISRKSLTMMISRSLFNDLLMQLVYKTKRPRTSNKTYETKQFDSFRASNISMTKPIKY